MSDLRSKSVTIPAEQRRHSMTELRQTVRILSRDRHRKVLTRLVCRKLMTISSNVRSKKRKNLSMGTHPFYRFSPSTILTIRIVPHPNVPSSLHWNSFVSPDKRRVMRLNEVSDQRRLHYPRGFLPRTRHTLTPFSQNLVRYPRPVENKSPTRTLPASDPTSG